MGPAAYDVASLLQDARVDVPEMMEIALLSRYTRARLSAERFFRCAGLRARLCHTGRAARVQDPRHFRTTGTARPQAAIFAPSAAGMGLSAALFGASGVGAAGCLVPRERAVAESLTHGQIAKKNDATTRHGAGCRARHAHAPAHRQNAKAAGEGRGQSLIDHVLDRLAEAGVERAVVNVHHFADQMRTTPRTAAGVHKS